jgi:hypothetical protein
VLKRSVIGVARIGIGTNNGSGEVSENEGHRLSEGRLLVSCYGSNG